MNGVGFKVVGNFQPPRDADDEVGEIDLICFRDDHLFIFEIKSGYMLKTQRDAWQHRTSTLRKARRQLKLKSALVFGRLITDPTLSTLIGDRDHQSYTDTLLNYRYIYRA